MIKRTLTTAAFPDFFCYVSRFCCMRESYLNFTQGMEAYKEHQWMEAMGAFLDVSE